MDGQISIFDIMYPKFKIDKPIRTIELFSGYGSQALSIKYLNVHFEHWKTCEWAIKSIQAYKDIHMTNDNTNYSKDLTEEEIKEYLYSKGISQNYNEPMAESQIKRLNEKQVRTIYNNIQATHNLVNIQQVKGKDLEIKDTDKYIYICSYSFPCQDLSLAGKGKGFNDTSTRSGMLWEVERILSECKEKPQILLMENVPQVHQAGDNAKNFHKWQVRLEEMGYKNYMQDLIATDYGIPQTRNRCFMVSILGEYSYTFPKPIPLKLKLKDMLEDQVDEKYYLSEKQIKDVQNWNAYQKPLENMEQIDKSNISPTLTTRSGAYAAGRILIKNDTKKGYLEAEDGDGIDISTRMQYHRGTVQKGKTQTLTTQCDRGVVVNDKNIYNLFFTIFDLCCTIDTKEKDKYERSRELLQILWEEIGKKEIWQEIRRFIGVQKKKILQSNLYENELYEDRELQSRISSSPSNSEKHNESITNREKMFNMWKEWKTRYTPQRWELSEQQFRQFNLFMQELSYETAQGETSMQDMWETNERFRVLQQTLFEIQEIWRPIENKISNGLRIRKLSPLECWRLMGVKDKDYENCAKNQSNASLYHLAGDSICTGCLIAIFGELLEINWQDKLQEMLHGIDNE